MGIGYPDFSMEKSDIGCESDNLIEDDLLIFEVVRPLVGDGLWSMIFILVGQAMGRLNRDS